jgi:hypothetical protein
MSNTPLKKLINKFNNSKPKSRSSMNRSKKGMGRLKSYKKSYQLLQRKSKSEIIKSTSFKLTKLSKAIMRNFSQLDLIF